MVENAVGDGPPPRAGRRPTLLNSLLFAAAALLAGVAVLGLVGPESAVALVALTPGAGWVLIAALPLVVVAVLRRQRALTAVAGVLCLLQLSWLWGAYRGAGPQPAPFGAATVRLLSANLMAGNTAIDTLAARLRDSGADVVSLQEVTPEHLARLTAAGLGDAYPYSVTDPLPYYHGSAIFSKRPLSDARAFDVQGSPMMTATITAGGQPLRVIDVHAVAPLSGVNLTRWRAQLAELAAMAPAPGAEATVLIGDFNATLDHRSLAGLLDAGWRDAFHEAGDGFGFTYPQGPAPLLRLDHAMVSEPITVLDARTRENPGSDHRMLAVDLALPAAS
jgi:endonuclease/exonuclease/phosphatase (EEP) superfamily protein YafD